MIWLRRIVLGLGGLAALAILVVFAGSEWVLRRGHAATLRPVPVPTDPREIAEGGRLARVTGCRDCHGRNGEGTVLVDDAAFGRVAPPPLARVVAGRSDAAVARAVRNGVSAADGHGLLIMPVAALGRLSDQDVGRIVGWMRTLRPSARDVADGGVRLGPVGRALVVSGKLPVGAMGDHPMPRTRPAAVGRYLVEVSCASCHALDRDRPTDDGRQVAPALAVVGPAYDDAAFVRLLRTGRGMGPRDLGLMRTAAQGGLSQMTDAEIAAVHEYLKEEGARLPAS